MEREGGWDEEVGSILERRVNGLILEGRAGGREMSTAQSLLNFTPNCTSALQMTDHNQGESTCRRWNTKSNTYKHTYDLNVRMKRVQDPKVLPAFPEEQVCHGQIPSGVKEGPQLGGESLHAQDNEGLEGHSSCSSLMLKAPWDCSNFSAICFHFASLAPDLQNGPYEGQGHGITLTSIPDLRKSICHAFSLLNPSNFRRTGSTKQAMAALLVVTMVRHETAKCHAMSKVQTWSRMRRE